MLKRSISQLGARALRPRSAQPVARIVRSNHSAAARDTVKVTFMDWEGSRFTAVGRVGQNLMELANLYKIELDGDCGARGGTPVKQRTPVWAEDVFGEGAYCSFCHVVIDGEHFEKLDSLTTNEDENLGRLFEGLRTPTSRLACHVTLTEAMDGMVVLIPDGPPSDLV